jgi:IS30 family transposase
MAYKHLTYALRCKISAFYKAGFLQKDIAIEVGVDPSTVSRELIRNKRWNGVYCPDQAQSSTKIRRKNSKKPIKFTKEIEAYIVDKLQIEWSPEQISGYAKVQNIFDISHERIYQFIWKNKLRGGNLFEYLRFGKRRRKKCANKNRLAYYIKTDIIILK